MSLVLSSSTPLVRVKTYGFGDPIITITHEKPPLRQRDVKIDQFLQLAAQFFWGYMHDNRAGAASMRLYGDRVHLDLGEGCLFDVAVCDFFHMIRYVLTNTDTEPNDSRHQFLESCRNLPKPAGDSSMDVMIRACQDAKLVPGFNIHADNNSTRYAV